MLYLRLVDPNFHVELHICIYYHSRLLHAPSTLAGVTITINKVGKKWHCQQYIFIPNASPAILLRPHMHVPLTSPKYLAIKASHFTSPKMNIKQEIDNTIITSASSFTCAIECNEIEWLYTSTRANFKRSFSSNDLVNLPSNGASYPTSPNGLERPLSKCMFFECSLNQVLVTCVW